MFTQLILYTTAILLFSNGIKVFQKSRKINYFLGKVFGFGLFSFATAVFIYGIRDIFVQLGQYKIGGEILIKVGGIFHILGIFLFIWFVIFQFSPSHLKKNSHYFGQFNCFGRIYSLY